MAAVIRDEESRAQRRAERTAAAALAEYLIGKKKRSAAMKQNKCKSMVKYAEPRTAAEFAVREKRLVDRFAEYAAEIHGPDFEQDTFNWVMLYCEFLAGIEMGELEPDSGDRRVLAARAVPAVVK